MMQYLRAPQCLLWAAGPEVSPSRRGDTLSHPKLSPHGSLHAKNLSQHPRKVPIPAIHTAHGRMKAAGVWGGGKINSFLHRHGSSPSYKKHMVSDTVFSPTVMWSIWRLVAVWRAVVKHSLLVTQRERERNPPLVIIIVLTP